MNKLFEKWAAEKAPVAVFHTNGYMSSGTLEGYDDVFLHLKEHNGADKLIKWTAVSSVQPEAEGRRTVGPDWRQQQTRN